MSALTRGGRSISRRDGRVARSPRTALYASCRTHGYSREARFTPGDLISRLRTFVLQTNHEFWPDDVSLRDPAVFAGERIHGSRQVTDLYLLALAAKHDGRFATFDGGIPASAARHAKADTLCAV
jgi:predicted nucleic acid-binding protein